MKKSHLIGALCAVVFAVMSLSSHAALLGRLPSTPGGTDYQAYYDDVAGLTWLADANAGAGSAFDDAGLGGTTTDGQMNWANANAWAANLNINGVTGWRLPTTLQPDSSCNTQGTGFSSGYNCTGSEMGNMYHNVLGGTGGFGSPPLATSHNSNYDLFSNVQPYNYWSSTEYAGYAWALRFNDGKQFNHAESNNDYAWAVQSGDVGTAVVPVPAAAWLFGSGLLGLIGIARKKAA